MIELKNCEVHDNTFVEHAVVNAVGTVMVDQPSSPTPQPATSNPQPSSTPSRPSKRGRKPKVSRRVTDTYTYRWMERQEGRMRLVKLYQLLVDHRFQMLSADVNPDDWCALFMGTPRAFTMKWTGKQAHLRYLFKLMLEAQYITHDTQSAGKWEILGSHFVDKSGRPFDKWDKQHDPKRGAKTLQMLAGVLNIADSLPNPDD